MPKLQNKRRFLKNIWIGWRSVKNHNRRHLFLALFILAFPFFSHGIDGRFERKQFGQYKVSLSQEFASGLAKVVIKKGKDKVFEEAEVGNHYYFGNNFDKVLDGPDLYSGSDITGNEIPNLVVSNWTGGAHCCHFLHIFELGKKLKKLVTVEANSSSIRLVDLDRDGFPEIEFWDGSIDYQFASFAGSPGGRVVLKFHKDHYEVATHLMEKPAPTTKKMSKLKRKLSAAFSKEESPELPYEFLNTMMNLSYSGHFKLALSLADETWPAEKPGLEKFKNEFSQALHDSLYWKEF
jgi:hypothetical protein